MTKKLSLLAAMVALGALSVPVLAQFDFGGTPELAAWEMFKLNPTTRVTLDFRNASVDAIIRTLTQASGITIIKDPTLTSTMTLQSPRPQTLKDAFAMFNTALSLRNFDLSKEGNFMVVRPRQGRVPFGNFPVTGGDAAPGGFGGGRGNQPVLKVYPIKYANATQVARVINDVFATSGDQNANPFANFPGFGGGPGGGGPGGRQRGNNPFAFGAGGAGGAAAARRGAANASVVKASADDFSNSVIINAPPNEHVQIQLIIDKIDKQTDQPQTSVVYALKYANATDVAAVVQNVLVSNAPRGRGGIGTQNVPIDQRFQQAARFGSAQAAFGQVVADQRTNSLVVTATQENLDMVAKVIDRLDKPVTFASGAFVITLKNARADTVAQTLNQAFATRNNNASTLTNLTNRNNTSTSTTNRNRTNSSSQPLSLGRSSSTSSRAAQLANRSAAAQSAADAEDEATADERLQIAQGFGGGGFGGGGFGGGGQFRNFGGGGTSSQNRTPTGIGENGEIVNVRDLAGNVIAIPDVNTNSVIIVTYPENRETVNRILDQLDKIPEQVMIETLIVEASLDVTNKLGVEWNFTAGKSNATQNYGLKADTTQPQGLRYTLTGTQYGAFLQAVQTDTRFQVLSTPRIFTSNNTTAEINISQSLPYVTSQREDVNGNLTFTYDFLDVGIVLTVTPRITSNGFVTMDVSQTANDFVSYTSFNAPIVNQREAQTTVSVKDGETVVLGGIIKNSLTNTVNKIPLLGDIPLIGNLFRSRTKTTNRTELLVFLTPRVVRDEKEAQKLRERSEQQVLPATRAILEQSRHQLEPIVKGKDGKAVGPDAKQNSTAPPTTGDKAPGTTAPPTTGDKTPDADKKSTPDKQPDNPPTTQPQDNKPS